MPTSRKNDWSQVEPMTQVSSRHGTQPVLKMLSLFSGAGGMDIGLELAGFHPIACLEIDELAKKTLISNRPTWPVWDDGDVIKMAATAQPKDLDVEPGELDLIAGGPPCQPFSTAGQWSTTGRRGMGDIRANTVHAMLDILEKFKPKAVFMENVQGFLSGKASALPAIKSRIADINSVSSLKYQIHLNFINAADYGVPQNRKRSMLVIVRDDIAWEWPKATHDKHPITAWDAIGDVDEHPDDLPSLQGKWSELLPSIPEGWNYQWLTSRGGGEEIFGYRTKYWNFLLKLAKDSPAWTLPASPGPATGPFHWDNRPLSPRERLRLQSFPDYWALKGDFKAQTKLAGNATPPLLAEVIGKNLAAAAGVPSEKSESLLLRPRLDLPKERAKPEPIPPSYRHLIGSKRAHGGTGQGPAPRSMEESIASQENYSQNA